MSRASTSFLARIDAAVRCRNLFPDGQPILVAVSGGLDSMVLLHVLHRLARPHRWPLFVAHFNHRLRGKSSDADEALVRATSDALGLKFSGERGDVRTLASNQRLSLEMAGRRLRHEFLARVSRQLGLSRIAAGHHADDQLELFFLRLLRGAGGEGLAGMNWFSPSPADPGVQLVRPFLGVSKAELLSFAEEEGVTYRQDASNADVEFERNRVRHRLLPLLRREFQPALLKTILRSMEIVGAEADLAAHLARAWRSGRKRVQFERLHLAVQRQVLRIGLLEMGIVPEFDLIEQLRGAANRPVAVRPALSLWRDLAGQLHRQSTPSREFSRDETVVDLAGPKGMARFAGLTISWQIRPQPGAHLPRSAPRSNCEYFDAGKIGSSVVLRHWRAGDRFLPIGLKRAVKLQDLFTNQKIPRPLRHQLVVAATARGEIFWVEGLRISERFKLRSETSLRLRWSWRRDAGASTD